MHTLPCSLTARSEHQKVCFVYFIPCLCSFFSTLLSFGPNCICAYTYICVSVYTRRLSISYRSSWICPQTKERQTEKERGGINTGLQLDNQLVVVKHPWKICMCANIKTLYRIQRDPQGVESTKKGGGCPKKGRGRTPARSSCCRTERWRSSGPWWCSLIISRPSCSASSYRLLASISRTTLGPTTHERVWPKSHVLQLSTSFTIRPTSSKHVQPM